MIGAPVESSLGRGDARIEFWPTTPAKTSVGQPRAVRDHRIERAFSSSVSGVSTGSCDFLVDPLKSYSE